MAALAVLLRGSSSPQRHQRDSVGPDVLLRKRDFGGSVEARRNWEAGARCLGMRNPYHHLVRAESGGCLSAFPGPGRRRQDGGEY